MATLIATAACGDPAIETRNHDDKLFGPAPQSGQKFGLSLTAGQDVLVVGASDAAVVFQRTPSTQQWNQAAILVPDDAMELAQTPVALADDSIGVCGTNVSSGLRYLFVFERAGSSWDQVARFAPTDQTPSDRFCSALDGAGSVLVARAAGAAYVYERDADGWSATEYLATGDAEADNELAASVATNGSTIVLGRRAADPYVFERPAGDWQLTARLRGSQNSLDSYGTPVALNRDFAIVGAQNSGAHATGAAYVFERVDDQWRSHSTLEPNSLEDFATFGASLAVAENRLVVGAYRDGGELQPGAAYWFELVEGTWVAQARLEASDESWWLGRSVAATSNALFAGTEFDEEKGAMAGAVYVFQLDDL